MWGGSASSSSYYLLLVTTIPYTLYHAVTTLFLRLTQTLCMVFLCLTLSHYCGYLHRFIWYVAETELTKLANDTPVTIGQFRCDLIRGKVWASNVILHSPRRQTWHWESPVLGRVGYIYVETNLVWCIVWHYFMYIFFWRDEELPLELYTIHARDIQTFIERKTNVFNFYLLDPHIELPSPVVGAAEDEQRRGSDRVAVEAAVEDGDHPPRDDGDDAANDSNAVASMTIPRRSSAPSLLPMTQEEAQCEEHADGELEEATGTGNKEEGGECSSTQQRQLDDEQGGCNKNDNKNGVSTTKIPSLSNDAGAVVGVSWSRSTGYETTISSCDGATAAQQQQQQHGEEVKAQQLVNEMVAAIKSLGKAAMEGNTRHVMQNHNQMLRSKLEAIRTTKDKSSAMQEGLSLVQHVSKAVVSKTQAVIDENKVLVQPTKRPRSPSEKDVYARIGRVVIDDVRIFTPDNWDRRVVGPSTAQKSAEDDNSNQAQQQQQDGISTTTWNRPIHIQHVVIRAAELCPPLSAKDTTTTGSDNTYNDASAAEGEVEENSAAADNNSSAATASASFPAVYQTIDKSLDTILKRVLAEIAKSNSGRLLHTAMGEVIEFWREKDSSSTMAVGAGSTTSGGAVKKKMNRSSTASTTSNVSTTKQPAAGATSNRTHSPTKPSSGLTAAADTAPPKSRSTMSSTVNQHDAHDDSHSATIRETKSGESYCV